MHNWIADEKRFKNIEEIIEFLKNQPEVKRIVKSNKKDRYGNIVLKVKFSVNIHPARKFCIAKYIQERAGGLGVSVI